MRQETPPPSACPLCDAANFKNVATLKRGRNLIACRECGLHFVHPPAESSEDIYNNDYYRSWGMGKNGLPEHVIRLKESNMRRHAEEIKKHVPEGRILEIGSAMGSFLKVARESGFSVLGIEVSKQACTVARSYVGEENVINDTLENVDLAPGSVEVIFMSDLIEHIPRPLPFLEKAVSLLKKGGLLYFITPDPEHWSRFIFGKNWVHFKDEHPVFFTRRTFTWVADRFSCKLVDFTHVYKYINLEYLKTQIQHFNHDLPGRAVSMFVTALPVRARELLFPLALGEARCIIRK